MSGLPFTLARHFLSQLHAVKSTRQKHHRMEASLKIHKPNWWKSTVTFSTRGTRVRNCALCSSFSMKLHFCRRTSLTLQAVSVEQLLAFLVHFDPALRAAHTLPSDAPQQTLALVAVSGRGGGPHLKVVRRGAGDGIDESLQSFLVHVIFLLEGKKGVKEAVTAEDSEG